MTALDTALVPMVTDLLDDVGVTATLTRVTQGEYDGIANVRTPNTMATQTVKASPPEKHVAEKSDGTSVVKTSLATYIGSTDTSGVAVTEPTPKVDRILISGATYRIVWVETLRSGDSVAAYQLGVAKG